MPKPAEDREFEVPMTLTFRTTVMVRASSKGAARDLADRGHFDDDGMAAAELVDWEITGAARAS